MSDPSADLLGIPGIVDPVRVGQGTYGVVYRASQPAFSRAVAIKVLTTLLDDESRHQFDRECRTLGSLSGHPHIVTLYGAGITDFGHPYLIMDYLPGGSLASQLSSGPFDWHEATAIGVKLAGALAAAHDHGILHRDIKPENVLVSAYGEPQLGDFGVAKIQGGTQTSMSTITGSVAHAAPEVLSGMAATVASDIWSLASTLATLLSGHPPFHREGDESLHPLITRILTQPPEDLRLLAVPGPVCEVIEAGLAKDSWARPPTAVDFGHALQDAERQLGEVPTTMLDAATVKRDRAQPAKERIPTLEPETSTRKHKRGDTPMPAAQSPAPPGTVPTPSWALRRFPYTRSDRIRTPVPEFSYTVGRGPCSAGVK